MGAWISFEVVVEIGVRVDVKDREIPVVPRHALQDRPGHRVVAPPARHEHADRPVDTGGRVGGAR